MKSKTIIAFILFLCSVCVSLHAQDRIIELSKTAHGWDNKNFGLCWYNDKDVLNIGSYKFCSPGKVIDVRMSPAGNSFAVLYAKGKGREVGIYNYADGKYRHVFRLSDMPTAIAYTANARLICIADAGRVIRAYSTSDYQPSRTIHTAFIPKKISISSNEYFVAAADEQILYVWNFETGRVRKVIELEHAANHITFSPDNNKMAVLLENGDLTIYDTRTFTLQETYNGMQDARECLFHPEGKYIAIITATDQVTILNMKNPSAERQVIRASAVGVNHLGYARTAKGVVSLVYNAGTTMVFHPTEDLTPDYQHMVALEVEEKMDDWLKQMPGESLEDYRLRVNEETRALQYSKFENEVATNMAGDLVEEAEVSFGSYNQEQNMLEINFDNMPDIFLEVPQEDVAQFSNPQNLKFENSVYAVTEDDKFELLYTEVTNTETGKTYVFDNLEKQSLDYLASDDSFVPLDLIQQSSMEEIKLQEIREEVVTAAQEASLISEHTHIDVKTKVEASTNADGEKIIPMALTVCFPYLKQLAARFSGR